MGLERPTLDPRVFDCGKLLLDRNRLHTYSFANRLEIITHFLRCLRVLDVQYLVVTDHLDDPAHRLVIPFLPLRIFWIDDLGVDRTRRRWHCWPLDNQRRRDYGLRNVFPTIFVIEFVLCLE